MPTPYRTSIGKYSEIILIRVGNYIQFLHNVIETKSFGNINDKPEHFMVADE